MKCHVVKPASLHFARTAHCARDVGDEIAKRGEATNREAENGEVGRGGTD